MLDLGGERFTGRPDIDHFANEYSIGAGVSIDSTAHRCREAHTAEERCAEEQRTTDCAQPTNQPHTPIRHRFG